MAGESASESARRQREKAQRLLRSAELYERGAVGEQVTARVLSQLPATSWTVLHDLHWPGRRFANVDHLVIGPPGVFVIDSKNWNGRVEVRHDVLRQNGRVRESAVAGAAEAALAVARLTTIVPPHQVFPVLCFVRDESLVGWARDVMVCSTDNLVEMLTSRRAVLTDPQRQQVALDLDASLRAATSRADVHSAGHSRRTHSRRARPLSPAPPAKAARRRQGPARRSRRRNSRGRELLKLLLLLLLIGFVIDNAEPLSDVISSIVMENTQPGPAPAEPQRERP